MHSSPYDIKLIDKIIGVNSSNQLNGGSGKAKIDFDEATLYTFQHLTIKPQYYTKHYIIGNEHIATTFGNGRFVRFMATKIT